MSARVYAFWSINDRLDQKRLHGQLLELKRHGYDGVIFHPRFYPNDPPYLGDEWMRILSALILDARDAGMDFWVYDENGWPSGSVDGELLRRYPEAPVVAGDGERRAGTLSRRLSRHARSRCVPAFHRVDL